MLRATLKSLAARKLRLGMSAFAIVLGVAFVVGSYVFTDTIDKTFDDIFGGLSSDVVVRADLPGEAGFFSGFDPGTTTTVPAGLVGEIAGLPGVERADGEVESQSLFVLDTEGEPITTQGAPGVAVNWHDGPTADGSQVLELVDGEVPDGAGEVALDTRTFDRSGYRIGDQVDFVSSGDTPRVSAELVGVVRFGDSGSLAGASLSVFDTATAQQLFLDGRNAFSRVAVTTTDDASATEVRDQVAQVLPDGLESVTGAEVDEQTASAIEEGLSFFNTFLLVFAAIALFVGVFLILNTFSILVAQRSQEMALLRALGAGRRQVTRSVLVEAVVVGLVGSTVGLALGLGVAQLLKVLFGAFGLELGGGLVVLPRTIVVAYAVGVLVTMVAAFVPARRAARVPPVAAMRDDVVLPESSRQTRTGVGSVIIAGGAAAMLVGLFTGVGNAALVVGLGILAVFVGVAMLAPIISVPVIRVLAGWYPKAFGTVGRLARENALRNPRRTAATASALMIGMALVSAISIVGASANATVDRALDDGVRAQFVISNAVGQPFSPDVARQAAQVDGVAETVSVRAAPGQVDGRTVYLQAFDPEAFSRAAELEFVDGDGDLGGGGVLVGEDTAESDGVAVGDEVRLSLPGSDETVPVVGVYTQSPVLSGGYVVSQQTLAEGAVPPVDSLVYVVTEDGADPAAVQNGLDEATADVPTVTVQDQEAYKQQSRDQVNQLLSLVYALLGLAVLIAILGIVNTLALSVMERTREVGLLRAVGLSRRQLRRTVRLESIVIAVLGAVLGVALGVVFGIALQQAVSGQGLEVLALPAGRLAVFVVLAGVVGVLAAVWPARRAAKLDVLRAITTE
ncbi:putative ABC transport system permease protein [Haloactinopolyspora alba]|uniref:Putative ABC transport system permease protein n=1 Tax=Haloactinopolyspora alba TaxID=648780 RepID=A0A2P8D9D5_9ACTN|nr:FtsX-like permease family protein [Haloactinopolyspora alba]PSK93829.1 putative ABC transport system permease protein [Haloactinopolyspora alba]